MLRQTLARVKSSKLALEHYQNSPTDGTMPVVKGPFVEGTLQARIYQTVRPQQ